MQKNKIKQSELAEIAQISQGAISRYLNGKASPKAEELHRISIALNTTMEALLVGDESPAGSRNVDSGWRKKALDAESKLEGLREDLRCVLKKFS